MSMTDEVLLETLKSLPAQQRAEVEDFLEFLAAKAKKRVAMDRLLAMAPALEETDAVSVSDEEITVEIKAARSDRHARTQA